MFGDMSECSVSCGIGIAVRKRKCDNPLPQNGGKNCAGDDTQTQTCTKPKCPGRTRQCIRSLEVQSHFEYSWIAGEP